VHELTRRMTETFSDTVLCPRASGAARSERRDGVQIIRYRYAPAQFETLVNDGGITGNLKKAPWKWLLVPGFLLARLLNAWFLVRPQRSQVIHTHWLVPQGLIGAVLTIIESQTPPFLVTSHGADLYTQRSRLMLVLKRFVARRAAAMTVVSAGMLEEMARQGIRKVHVEVQPMGVDLSTRFTLSSSIERDDKQLLYVGRMVEKKGLKRLIAAMPVILGKCADATLRIVGFGPDEAALRTQVNNLVLRARVHFYGPATQAELPNIYRLAAVLVAPFLAQEGLGLGAIEAAGCGCRLVLGGVAAARGTFGAVSGVEFAHAADRDALAAACLRALQQPEPKLASIELLRERFAWGARAQEYRRILSSLASGGGR